MGRGLSDQQVALLRVLERTRTGKFMVTGDIIDALGLPRKPAVYASVSRALGRLCSRGMVLVYQPNLLRPGKGFGYGLPE